MNSYDLRWADIARRGNLFYSRSVELYFTTACNLCTVRSGSSIRQDILTKSGFRPVDCTARIAACVGFVFCSSFIILGTKVTSMCRKFSLSTLPRSRLTASRNGAFSISPAVPQARLHTRLASLLSRQLVCEPLALSSLQWH